MAELYVTIALNISVTTVISVYLYIYHRRFLSISPNDSSPITNIISMLAESAALIVAFDLFFIIPFAQAQNSDEFSNLPLQLLAYVQAIGAFLTIFRVAQGKAWVTDDCSEVRRSSLTSRPSKLAEA
ncbi:hypothetical protein BDQ17DRAFT_1350751 [Cyathus striatus]|nr:hypothetical protein BDQ17DRAFT_1350751 [Cyathus striatus]